jgi:class 3 adenylate cyclase
LMTKAGGIGALVLFRKEVRPYKADEIALVETFAAQAVIAIENVQQFQALEDLNAELGERVERQVSEIERMGRLKRFRPPALAEVMANADDAGLANRRSLIATLFCDIKGFTALCEIAEPGETIEVLRLYHEEMSKLIAAHGAGLDKRTGSEIMVIFNDPLPCEDPAGDAVRLARQMRWRMAELCNHWKRQGHRLGFGVGIALGDATIGSVRCDGHFDYVVSGTTVHLAVRLCDHADDGQILIGPRAFAALGNDVRAKSNGEISLDGMREPVEVFELASDL